MSMLKMTNRSCIKKFLRLVGFFGLIGLISLILSACSGSLKSTTQFSPSQIAEAVITAQDNISELHPLIPNDDYFSEYMSKFYMIKADEIKDGVIYYADGMQANEIAIFLLEDNLRSQEIKDALITYKESRTEAFTGYAPEQAAILENGVVLTHGNYVALLICKTPQDAEDVFLSCFSDNPPKMNDDTKTALPKSEDDGSEIDNEVDGDSSADKADIFDGERADSSNGAGDGNGAGKTRGTDMADAASDMAMSEVVPNESSGAMTGEKEEPLTTNPSETAFEASTATTAKTADTISTETVTEPAVEPASTILSEKAAAETTTKSIVESTTVMTPDTALEATTETIPKSAADPVATAVSDKMVNGIDEYDAAGIKEAWRSGNKTGLSAKNRRILEACAEIINANIRSDMSELEKETIINDWIVDWASYDKEASSNAPDAKPDPDNDNPYGVLFSKKAICWGYTHTFQLFMDLLDIECITIGGIASHNGNEHAWNMVRIDEKWYCVDVTWNDPTGNDSSASKRKYLNVSSQYMLDTGHKWDESSAPVAE